MIERAFNRSFDESGSFEVYDVDAGESNKDTIDRAKKRVNLLLDHPTKAAALVTSFIRGCEDKDLKVDSPAVNRMLDKWT